MKEGVIKFTAFNAKKHLLNLLTDKQTALMQKLKDLCNQNVELNKKYDGLNEDYFNQVKKYSGQIGKLVSQIDLLQDLSSEYK